MSQEVVEKTFEVPSPARFKLSNISGAVEIRPGEEGKLHITAIKHTERGNAQQTEIELSQAPDGTVTAATHFGEGWWGWLTGSHPCAVDYLVTAPRSCSLKVNGVSSPVLTEGFDGEFSFNSVSGDLTLRELNGSLRTHTVSGRVDGERITGALDVDSVSGSVCLRSCDFSSAEAKTVSGSLELETALSQGPYRFNSVSGSVHLLVPAETHCTAELHTISGSISTDLPLSAHGRSNGKQIAEVQGGGVRVEMHSVSGELRIGLPAGVTPPQGKTVPPRGTAKVVDRRAILERIERGEISVEEGLNQLHA